ncbi:hypothetical protein GCM10010254_74370 [Streptomyces chromofuscus]|nr:hypothetical protein GCM10010254_74370 [Streptomyces chromofuscus]
MLPGTPGGTVRSTVFVLARASGPDIAFAFVVGRVSGRARAAAQVTPMEEARCLRMLLILDIAMHICPSGN